MPRLRVKVQDFLKDKLENSMANCSWKSARKWTVQANQRSVQKGIQQEHICRFALGDHCREKHLLDCVDLC